MLLIKWFLVHFDLTKGTFWFIQGSFFFWGLNTISPKLIAEKTGWENMFDVISLGVLQYHISYVSFRSMLIKYVFFLRDCQGILRNWDVGAFFDWNLCEDSNYRVFLYPALRAPGSLLS